MFSLTLLDGPDHQEVCFLLVKGRPRVRVRNTLTGECVTGKRAAVLASNILPVECWPEFALPVFSTQGGDDNEQQERLFS